MTQTPLFLASKFAETLNSGNVDLFDTFIAEAYINHNPFVAPGLLGSLAREVSVTTFLRVIHHWSISIHWLALEEK